MNEIVVTSATVVATVYESHVNSFLSENLISSKCKHIASDMKFPFSQFDYDAMADCNENGSPKHIYTFYHNQIITFHHFHSIDLLFSCVPAILLCQFILSVHLSCSSLSQCFETIAHFVSILTIVGVIVVVFVVVGV